MKQKQSTRESMRLALIAVVTMATIAVIGAAVWFFWRPISSSFPTPTVQIPWLPWGLGGLVVGVLIVIVLHSVHEEHAISSAVADALHNRDPLTDDEFGKRHYAKDLAPLAAQLRRMLADNLGCDLSGMVPSDDFEKWLYLSTGPDSAADSFFEALAIELQLHRDCPWPDRFGSFDALVDFVRRYSRGGRAHDFRHGLSDA